MKPELTEKNRSQLFFIYFMDCQTPQKPGGGAGPDVGGRRAGRAGAP